VIVDNRPGAGSSIAADTVARSPADGYTLLLSTTAQRDQPQHVSQSEIRLHEGPGTGAPDGAEPGGADRPGQSPANSVRDLVAARAAPGKLTFASSGNGTFTHLYGELFNSRPASS
jgi:tripartite-type tricarboxylate transporter receptor subunit TctC